ncbi:MAG: metallophosphoesterase [Cellvibrionaceae bacterium]
MKICYASDIHSEFVRYPDIPGFSDDAEVIVLAGDIGVGTQASSYVAAVAAEYSNARVIWVAGNHEFYGSDLDSQIETFRRFAQRHPRVDFLENAKVELNGVTFLGCTLWTDFSALGAQADADCRLWGWQRLADGSNIRCEGHPLSCRDVVERFQGSCRWLDDELSRCDPARTVVVTHFPPCREARHGVIPEDYLSAYFQANAKHLIDAHQPRYWIYGHNHWSDRLTIGKTRLISNQLGYQNEHDTMHRFRDSAHFELLRG